MKKILTIILATFISTAAFSQASVCGQFHKKYCILETAKGEKWMYNAQSKSGLFNQGMVSKLRCVIYKGMDYRITVCCKTVLGDKVNYKIFDGRTNELLFDKPVVDNKRLRVSGPFTVETLQNFEPISPNELETEQLVHEDVGDWSEKIKQHLLSTGIKNGRKDERVTFSRVELLADSYLHAEGFYLSADQAGMNGKGEKKVYIHIGPKFGTVSRAAGAVGPQR